MTAVNTAQAESALAYELQSSKQQQLIIAEELNVDLGKLIFSKYYGIFISSFYYSFVLGSLRGPQEDFEKLPRLQVQLFI